MAFDLLPPSALLASFVAASAVLALTPGPGVAFIVARTLAQGRGSGLASVAGVALGNLGNAVGASLGLAALFAVSSAAFTVVKLAGAAYLVWMGVALWRAAAHGDTASPQPDTERRARRAVWQDGLWVSLLNPKTTLFFAAFLPQFVSAPDHAVAQSLALGGLFVALAAVTDTGYVLLAARVAPRLRRAAGTRRLGQRAAGSAFIGLGLLAALGERPLR